MMANKEFFKYSLRGVKICSVNEMVNMTTWFVIGDVICMRSRDKMTPGFIQARLSKI